MKRSMYRIITGLGSRRLLFWMPDKMYLNILFYIRYGKFINFKKPITFNEKIQWLKIYNRNEMYPSLVDKLEVRQYIENTIGKEYLIPLIWDGVNINDIPWDNLPKQFVIKYNHGSHCNIICKNKELLNKKDAIKKLKKWKRKNWYWYGREWPYKKIKPRILIEKYMTEFKEDLNDYKFYCFNGMPKVCMVITDRSTNLKETFFDMKFNKLDMFEGGCENDLSIEKPLKFEEMKKLAKTLSKNIPFCRVDFYNIGEKVYFGEITFYPDAGFQRFNPKEIDLEFGSWISLK